MDFTIDDMIEFCESELEYHSKEADKRKEICFKNETPEGHSYMLGNHLGFKTAYSNMAESLVKLKQSQNEKIKEIIDWCQEEIDGRIKIEEDGYSTSRFKDMASSQEIILNAVKDKLCNIYEVNEP
jgi:hypothetical protein